MGNSFNKIGWRRGLIGLAVAVMSAAPVAAEQVCREDTVMLRGDWGNVRFSVEIADDPQEQAIGLMNRESMAFSAGMLFVYPRPQPISFWMRNTLIPLDMVFIDAQGVVQHIHHRAKPLDETPIFGGDNLLATLEINGGLSERLGISVGTQVRHPAFDPYFPAWPC